MVTRKVLKASHYAKTIVVRQSPTEAIDSLRFGIVKPNIIFHDIRKPKMNRFEFLQKYNLLDIDKKSIKIFMLSSSLDPVDMKQSAGNKYITQFIHKPLTLKALEELSA